MAAMMGKPGSNQVASVAVFCPQSKAPQESYLNQLHAFLSRTEHLKPFLQDIVNLKDFWSTFADERKDIAALSQGPRYMQYLSDWITTGKSSNIANHMSGIISLPLLVIIQIGQYFQYLEHHALRHSELLARLRKGGGIQGYCGGLPPAIAIACSKDEAEVAKNAGVAMRIALGIGAYGELGDDESIPGATTIVIRVKRVGQGEEIVGRYPGAYISAITDPKTISVVGPVPILAEMQVYARGQGLLVQEMHIRGKVHNPENKDLAKELCALCDKTESLQLPKASNLQAPVRSNRTGESLTDESLTNEIVTTILASRCEWYTLLTELAKDLDLTGRRSHIFATFGIGDCVPLLPFHKLQLHITKLDVLSFLNETTPRASSLEDLYSFPGDAVAIIGVACRLPGANSLEELWDLMSKGTSQHEEVPAERFDLHGSFRASQDWKFAGKKKFYGNFIRGVENFDNTFFGTNPKEALNMDPQQRILLEVAYQALESSGYLRNHRREAGDPVGCFIGASFVEYLDNTCSNPPTSYTSTGTIRAFLCGRLSYYFGWSGPAEVIDTACSSSLVAINRACKSVQAGECTMALTGGVNIITGIHNYLDLAKAGFLSPTGQCKPFDQSADGYCRSEGAGLVVLKLLSRAVADGDQILGVIPSVSTNQGGLSSSITIPHSPAQQKLYQTVLRQAGMKLEQVSYVEAHGTGTQAGDPLEIASIREVFGSPERNDLLHIGSLKGNLGHCETAAGVASLIKVLAMINKRSIPPQANHQTLNPKIPALGPDRMAIASELLSWNAPHLSACVNSYGAAGSNAALLCCEGPVEANEAAVEVTGITYPVILSAASRDSLLAYMETLVSYLERVAQKPSLEDLAFTFSEKRKHHKHRFIATATDMTSLVQSLKTDLHTCLEVTQKPKRVVLVFGGQSKQNVGLDEGLYQSHPPLRRCIDMCNDILKSLSFPAILPSIFQSKPISDIVALQCGTFVMQYACAKTWIDAGLEVDAVIGHSFGELTAVAVSGVLSLPDCLKLVASRATLMQNKWGPERGTMLAIFGSRETVEDVIRNINTGFSTPEVEIACFNSSTSQIVVSSTSSIAQVESLLERRFQGVRYQRLDVSHGFHSRFTDPILDQLDKISASLTFMKSEIPLETCTAEQVDQVQPSHISLHARKPVFFSDAVQRIEKRLGPCVWIEAGMNSPIIPMVKRALAFQNNHSYQAMSVKDAAPTSLLANVIMNLWREGISTSYWNFILSKKSGYRQIWLPPYQFQAIRHWLPNVDRAIEAQQKAPIAMPKAEEKCPEEPLRLVSLKNDGESSKDFTIHVATHRFKSIVSGHAVRQRPLCPASMYMECAAMAVQMLRGDLQPGSLYFEDLNYQAALGVDLTREVILTLQDCGDKKSWNFTIKSAQKGDSKKFVTHAKGIVGLGPKPNLQTYQRLIEDSMSEVTSRPNTEKLMSNRAYGLFSQVVHYAKFLQAISHIILDGTRAIADIDIPAARMDTNETTVTRVCDTIAIDSFIQVVGLLINSSDLVTSEDVYVATGVDRISMSAACNLDNKAWTVYTKFQPLGDVQATGDVFVMTRDRTLVMTIMGVQFTKLLISRLEKFLDSANAKPQATIPITPPITSTPEPTSETTSEHDSGSPGLTRVSSMTSIDEEPEVGDNGAEESLRNLIATYTGLAASEIAKDAIIGDLGVDSLAAVELAEELQGLFDKEIEAEDLLISSYEALCKVVLPTPSTKAAPTKRKNPLPPSGRLETLAATHGLSTPAATVKGQDSQKSSRRGQVLKLISESSGADVSSIDSKDTLQTIGIDSLSAVELKSEIEDAFSIEIGDDRFTLESTVDEILEFLGIDSMESTPKSEDTGPSPVRAPKSNVSGRKSAETRAIVANPLEVLTQIESSFDASAQKRGFLNYWAKVAPQQDELLLAYIAEAFWTLNSDLWKIPRGEEVPMPQHLPKHGKVMQRLLDILEKHKVIQRKGSTSLFRGDKELLQKSSKELHESFVSQFPLYGGEARLMALTGPKLAECLIGKADPVAIMFRTLASQKVMGEYYCDSPMLSTLTEHLVTFMREIVSKTDTSGGQPLRILEVGAGFGGTTGRLAQVLHESGIPVEYTFTDIASTLVKNAKAKFAMYPWMKFQTFSLENDVPATLEEQFDMVVGTNCVHATTDKTASVTRLRQTLRKDGFIVLSEVTELVDWYDIVFGLLDGWWLADHGKSYPLQPPDSWMRSFKDAGYASASYSKGPTPESNTQRLLVASKREVRDPAEAFPIPKPSGCPAVETVVYKEVAGTKILADIYLPNQASGKAMPIALMIHGGGYMTLSKKAIRPAQTSFLLANNILPVSLDYRLCPEINMIDGPIADTRDAFSWAQKDLPQVIKGKGITVDTHKIVVIGWSSGGHLAMSTAWTTTESGLKPPKAILSFYGPTDYESGGESTDDLDVRRAEMYPERKMSMDRILKSLPTQPITSYDSDTVDTTGLGWVRPGDPRSELVLSLFKEGNGLPLMLNGISNLELWHKQPDPKRVAAISPLAQLCAGRYNTPTFLIHGTKDEIVPFHTAEKFAEALKAHGVRSSLLAVKGVKHIHDLQLMPGTQRWQREVAPGYEFLLDILSQ
ncbi:MAG: hypothetical protein MMC33_009584 [Icmadophila ericetorum]|nr:hypothetical protein [Icmadophila ericetorum]